jgi:hypothetical protein
MIFITHLPYDKEVVAGKWNCVAVLVSFARPERWLQNDMLPALSSLTGVGCTSNPR